MTGRSRAGPRRGASISRPAPVIFHALVEPVAARLDDKLLDADIVADGVSFTIGQQAA